MICPWVASRVGSLITASWIQSLLAWIITQMQNLPESVNSLPLSTRGALCIQVLVRPPWRQLSGKSMVSLVNSHANATRIGWHLWDLPLGCLQGGCAFKLWFDVVNSIKSLNERIFIELMTSDRTLKASIEGSK